MTERFYREFDFEFPDRDTWTLGWMLRERAQTHADRVYLDVPDHGLSYTFAETLTEAEAIGRGFLDHGGEHGDRHAHRDLGAVWAGEPRVDRRQPGG